MKGLTLGRYALCMSAVIAALAGCGAPGTTPQSGGAALAPQARPLQPQHGTSWMANGAKDAKALLYLSDGSDSVSVYNYGNGQQVGELTGLDRPGGECVDAKGDVYIANSTGGYVAEYARGGTSPLATYSTNGTAIGCAVDKKNDLAVANIWGGSSGNPGGVCVWKHGKGKPNCDTGSGPCYYDFPPAYDDKDNLIFEGQANYTAGVCAILSGTSKITTLNYSGTICWGCSVMWDGKFIALTTEQVVGSNVETDIVQTTLSGTTLTSQSETTLSDTCTHYVEVGDPFVVGVKNTPVNDQQGKVIIGTDFLCGGSAGLGFWHYPEGGGRYKSFGSSEPEGEAVSFK